MIITKPLHIFVKQKPKESKMIKSPNCSSFLVRYHWEMLREFPFSSLICQYLSCCHYKLKERVAVWKSGMLSKRIIIIIN